MFVAPHSPLCRIARANSPLAPGEVSWAQTLPAPALTPPPWIQTSTGSRERTVVPTGP